MLLVGWRTRRCRSGRFRGLWRCLLLNIIEPGHECLLLVVREFWGCRETVPDRDALNHVMTA